MANEPVLFMLGLARRAGKLAWGDELTREACADKTARCVFVAADAGASAVRRAGSCAEQAGIPCVSLPHSREMLGAAIGRADCALCAVTDTGMAAAAVQKLAGTDPKYAGLAAALAEKNARIQSRRRRKKTRGPAEKTDVRAKARKP